MLVTFEAGPVIPEPENKQGQKAWMQALHGKGRAFKQRCSIALVRDLQELHPNGACLQSCRSGFILHIGITLTGPASSNPRLYT